MPLIIYFDASNLQFLLFLEIFYCIPIFFMSIYGYCIGGADMDHPYGKRIGAAGWQSGWKSPQIFEFNVWSKGRAEPSETAFNLAETCTSIT